MKTRTFIPFAFAIVCAIWACILEINNQPPLDQVAMALGFGVVAVMRANDE